jgi:hypothetical protein
MQEVRVHEARVKRETRLSVVPDGQQNGKVLPFKKSNVIKLRRLDPKK